MGYGFGTRTISPHERLEEALRQAQESQELIKRLSTTTPVGAAQRVLDAEAFDAANTECTCESEPERHCLACAH